MRVALITIVPPSGEGAAGDLRIGGKSLSMRQLDFALAAGCESIVLLASGMSSEAIGLRHAGEAAGAKVRILPDAHGLLGSVGTADELLVIAPQLLPGYPEVLRMLAQGPAIFVLPAAVGQAAGFERIDLERAWAGLLLCPGAMVERLSQLAPEAEASAALLRIALQARLPERVLPEAALAQGAWIITGEGGEAQPEAGWLKRNLPESTPFTPSASLARRLLQRFAPRLLAERMAGSALKIAAPVAVALAVVLASSGWAVLPFLLLMLAAVALPLAEGVERLRSAPFAPRTGNWDLWRWAIDAGLLFCGALSIPGELPATAFPAAALVAALHATMPARRADWGALLGDRGLLSLGLALAASFGFLGGGLMLATLAMLVLEAISRHKSS